MTDVSLALGGVPRRISAIVSRPRIATLPLIAGAIAVLVGAIVLTGWLFNLAALKSLIPGLLTMKANTALSFVLAGSGVAFLSSRGGARSRWPSPGAALVVVAVAIALATGAEYVTGRDLGIDQLLFREAAGQVGTVVPGRMSPLTVICFVLVGVAALLADRRRVRRFVLAAVAIAIAVSALNVFDVVFDGGVPLFLATYTQMALVTALTMAVLGLGVLGLVADSPLEAVIGSSATAVLARRLLLVAVVVPIFMAWLRLEGEKAGLYGTSYGTSLMLVGIVSLIVIAILSSVGWAANLDRQRAASELERDRFFALSPDLLAVIGADGCFQRVNAAWLQGLGWSSEAMVGRPFLEFLHPEDVASTMARAQSHFAGGPASPGFRNRYRAADGTYRWLEWRSQMAPDRSVAFAIARDVTDRQATEERNARQRQTLESRNASLSHNASHDPLTGLHNRRFFDRALTGIERRWSRLPPERRAPVALIIFDLDHFGAFNKDHGHQAGDAVLRAFAALLRKRFRDRDLVARYGGEEFVAVLEGATSADAARIAEGIRGAFERISVEVGLSEPLHCTVSAGAAQLSGDGGVAAALALADVWLAQAKRAGRNQVVGL